MTIFLKFFLLISLRFVFEISCDNPIKPGAPVAASAGSGLEDASGSKPPVDPNKVVPKPVDIDDESGRPKDKADGGSSRPAAGSNRHVDGSSRPADGSGKPAAGSDRHVGGSNRPADGSDRQVDGSDRQVDGSDRQVDGSNRPADDSNRPADDSGRPADGFGNLDSNNPVSSNVQAPDSDMSSSSITTKKKQHRLKKLFDETVNVLTQNGKIYELINQYKLDYSLIDAKEEEEDSLKVDLNEKINDKLSQILKKKEVRVGAYKNKNWGSIGNYTENPPTGFWPDLMRLIWRTISQKVFNDENAIKVKYLLYDNVFNALNLDEVDMTDIYFLSNTKDNSLRSNKSKIVRGSSVISHSNKLITLKDNSIVSFQDLKSYISNNKDTKIGCLTEANCNIFRDIFQNRVKYVYTGFSSYLDLVEAVKSKNIFVAVVSGLPGDFVDPELNIFDSSIKTLHSPYFK